MKSFLIAAAAAGLLMVAGPAAAQMESREGIALQNQILELRRDLQDLQAQIAAGAGAAPAPRARVEVAPNTAPSDIVANLLDRVSRLEDQVRTLRGRVDEIGNTVQHMNEDLTKQIGDLTFQLQNTPGGPRQPGASVAPPAGGTLSPPPTSLGSAPVTPAAEPQRTPELVLQQGNAALARRDYATAEAAARDVLAGRSPRAYDAQFLLAQALMGKRDYQQAAIAYDDAYNRGRTGPHAQDALVGLAGALGAINARPAACETLLKLRTEFPQLRPDVREATIAMRQRNGCG